MELQDSASHSAQERRGRKTNEPNKQKWTDKTPRQMAEAKLNREDHTKKHTLIKRKEEEKSREKRRQKVQ